MKRKLVHVEVRMVRARARVVSEIANEAKEQPFGMFGTLELVQKKPCYILKASPPKTVSELTKFGKYFEHITSPLYRALRDMTDYDSELVESYLDDKTLAVLSEDAQTELLDGIHQALEEVHVFLGNIVSKGIEKQEEQSKLPLTNFVFRSVQGFKIPFTISGDESIEVLHAFSTLLNRLTRPLEHFELSDRTMRIEGREISPFCIALDESTQVMVGYESNMHTIRHPKGTTHVVYWVEKYKPDMSRICYIPYGPSILPTEDHTFLSFDRVPYILTLLTYSSKARLVYDEEWPTR